MASIPVMTSIPASVVRRDGSGRDIGADYTRRCIGSWRDAGYPVTSFNAPDEAAAIAAVYPDVTFKPVARTALAERGRPFVYLADLMAQCDPASEALIGIINADILLHDVAALQRALAAQNGRRVFYGQRRDIHDPSAPTQGMRHAWGFDYFFFPQAAARRLADAGMMFGQNWWDYWFPVALAAQGYELCPVRSLPVSHLHHDAGSVTAAQLDFHYESFAQFHAALTAALPLPGSEPWTTQANVILGMINRDMASTPDALRMHPVMIAVGLTVVLYLSQDPRLHESFQALWKRYAEGGFDMSVPATVLAFVQILDGLARDAG